MTDPLLPRPIAATAACGDLLSAVLALVSLALLRNRVGGLKPMVWLMNLAGMADLLIVSIWGVVVGFPTFKLGAAWFIPTFLGPTMMVTHGLMVWLLVRAPMPVRA